jgi:hypothetical protein
VEAGPEGHPGVHGDHDIARLAAMAAPRRPDHDAAPDSQDTDVALPGGGPVGLVDDLRPQLPDLPQPEGLEVAEGAIHLVPRTPGGPRVARGQVGPDRRRRRRVDRRDEPFVDEREPRLDAHAPRGDAGEDLADRLDRLRIARHRQLEPGAGASKPAGDRGAGARGARVSHRTSRIAKGRT